jgi:trehalose 6-phosphate phosphatase
MREELNREVRRRLEGSVGIWLFLDYDGTLAEFAPTPDHVMPDRQVIDLVTRLAKCERARVTILSGRRMEHIRKLLPVSGITLAGTYGIEVQHPVEGPTVRLDAALIRPTLDEIKARWTELLRDRSGFYLEDKGLALALHARFAEEEEAERVLAQAREFLAPVRKLPEVFRVLGGFRFLEVGPTQAGKGASVAYLLGRYAWPGALLVFVGDDDKDEEAFEVIKTHDGIAVVTALADRPTHAQYRLESPAEVRVWLGELLEMLDQVTEQPG